MMKFKPKKPQLHPRIVVCGSMAFYNDMSIVKRHLKKQGVQVAIPDIDNALPESSKEETYQMAKRRASMRHIRRVRDQKTIGILVMNLDKHGVPDYIGPNTFAEIAVAFAHYKQIYLLQGIPEFYKDELAAWQAIPLHGDISPVISDIQEVEWYYKYRLNQLTLFDF